MKYSKKQIRAAFLEWTKLEKLTPSELMTDCECYEMDLEELTDLKTETLINYIK